MRCYNILEARVSVLYLIVGCDFDINHFIESTNNHSSIFKVSLTLFFFFFLQTIHFLSKIYHFLSIQILLLLFYATSFWITQARHFHNLPITGSYASAVLVKTFTCAAALVWAWWIFIQVVHGKGTALTESPKGQPGRVYRPKKQSSDEHQPSIPMFTSTWILQINSTSWLAWP